jgi:hypothetical protein
LVICDVSAEIGAAAVLDMAMMSDRLANYPSVWLGERVCEAEGLGVDLFASMFVQDDASAHLT